METIATAIVQPMKTFSLCDMFWFPGGFAEREIDMCHKWRSVAGAVKLITPLLHPPVRTGGGFIINTTSIQSDKPSPMLLAYAATKGAVSNFTAGLAQMLGSKGIRVNAVAPGPIWTPLIPSTMPPEKVKSFGEDTPLGRPGQPRELGGIFVLLASEEGSYMTGGVYAVTGGIPLL